MSSKVRSSRLSPEARRELVRQWSQSGESARAFGKRLGVSAWSLYSWRRLAGSRRGSTGAFVEVPQTPARTEPSPIEIDFGGLTVKLGGPDAPRHVIEIVLALRGC